MASENIPGFDSIGFRIPIDDSDRFAYLSKTVWGASKSYPDLEGECGAYSDEYLRVWTRFHNESINQVLESNPMPGLVASIESYIDSDLVKAWVWDREDQEAEEPIFPLCFRSPMPWMVSEDDAKASQQPFALTVLASQVEFFENEEALKSHADLGQFAAECVVPTGLFGEEGAEPGPGILVIGRILLAVNSENTLTEDKFHALRVRTLGGEVFVNLPQESVTEDVNGKLIAVQGIASGTFPHLIPPALPTGQDREIDAGGKPFSFDSNEVEAKLRQLCIEFYDGGEGFEEYFHDIHVEKLHRIVIGFMWLFVSGARGFVKTRGKATPKLAKRYAKAAHDAPIVFARIVMANTMVLYSGESSPALVVVAFGEGADEAMEKARKVLARIHFGDSQNEQERELAKRIEDEDYRFGKRRRLPEWLVGDVEAYAADLWIPSVAAHEEGLISEVLVCLAEPGIDGLTAAIPETLITRAMNAVKGPPPIPKKKTPPPIPPKD